MRCEEVMIREVECVSPVDTVWVAAARMREKELEFLPVCDRSKRVLGTLTDRDIVVRVVAERRPGFTLAEQVMTQEVVACRPQDELEEATRLMAANHASHMVCTDTDGHLVGVISLSDIARSAGAPGSATSRL
jgi:CBS domain-containing protein